MPLPDSTADPISETVGAGDAIERILAAAGVRRFYTVPGESFLEVLDAVERSSDLMLVSTRHESGAAFMAEADAKLTGVIAVAAATRAVGGANLAIGVHTAFQDSTPMLVLLGQVEETLMDKEAFQEVDLAAFFRPIAKWATTIHDTQRIPDIIASALTRAVSGRPGPVVVALPANVLAGHSTKEAVDEAIRRVQAVVATPVVSDDTVRALATAISEARSPVAIVGVGAQDLRDELAHFADHFGVGVYNAFRRQDVFSADDPHYLGHLTLGAAPSVLAALKQADLVLVLGSRLDEVTTQSFTLPNAGARVVHVGTDDSVMGVSMHSDWSIVGDVGDLLNRLEGGSFNRVTRDWSDAHQAALNASTPRRRTAANGLDPAAILEIMREQLPSDTIVASDAGNFSVFLHSYWPYGGAHTQLAPISGAMGYAVPAGVAAALARPDRPVIAVAGDGGFMMSGMEIETAVRYGAALTILVFRNGLYGTIAMHQRREIGRTAGIDIGVVDIAKLAEALGAVGVTVADESTLRTELERAMAFPGVTVLDIITDPDLITPSARLSEIGRTQVLPHPDKMEIS
ncbi:MAG: thiamine pyrophosphate-binding protein [Rhodoglobus sp.]|nr:thiamine pyrophosphate-binding protein [Rhodoglobus sp.]